MEVKLLGLVPEKTLKRGSHQIQCLDPKTSNSSLRWCGCSVLEFWGGILIMFTELSDCFVDLSADSNN